MREKKTMIAVTEEIQICIQEVATVFLRFFPLHFNIQEMNEVVVWDYETLQ